MSKEILRVRKTNNVRQIKKYVDEAISKGADTILFQHFDSENPYFLFTANLTPEEAQKIEIERVEKEYQDKISKLKSQSFKTYYLRIPKVGLCGLDIDMKIAEFKTLSKITNKCLDPLIKQVITDEYDDFDENMQTVFITEIINN